jgi:hypothetical protein
MTEVEYEDELEYEDDVGTMASKEKRADEIVSLSRISNNRYRSSIVIVLELVLVLGICQIAVLIIEIDRLPEFYLLLIDESSLSRKAICRSF